MADIKIAYCVTLYNIVNKILFVDVPQGEAPVERKLPFNVKYKLQKNMNLLVKDYAFFDSEKSRLIKEYGEEVDNGARIVVKSENIDEYKKEINKIMNMEVSRNFLTLTDKEVEDITGVDAECSEMELFIEYMTDNPKND